ncbi:MAG: ABC transporter permease [Erysipelotrichaceae bacterium]|nr:ABC transporter permease [Erysipelotrichaceae bacterium]
MKSKFKLNSSLVSSLIAIGLGLLFGLLIMLIVNPSEAFRAFSILIQGGFYKGLRSVGQVLYNSTPIMMTGLSVAFAFKCGLFNIGTPGQFIVGAFTAVYIAIKWTFIPDSLVWIVAIIAAGIMGALWALLPGILKAFRNVNEVISCIMMNYMGMLIVIELVKSTIYNAAGAESMAVSAARSIPKMGLDKLFPNSQANFGTIIAIILCIIAYIIMNKTTFGYELKACGYNSEASRYAGMNEKKSVVLSMVIAGFFAGVGGALTYIAGTGRTIALAETLAPEGFNGIPVALLGFNNPIGVIVSSLFIAYVNVGGNYMQVCNYAIEIIDIIIAAIIYFSSFALVIKLFLDRRKNSKKQLIGGKE